MTPARLAVLVDDHGADAFQKIGVRLGAKGDAVFQLQRVTQGRRRPQALLHRQRHRGSQRRGARQRFQRAPRKVAVIRGQRGQHRLQRHRLEMPVDPFLQRGQRGGGRQRAACPADRRHIAGVAQRGNQGRPIRLGHKQIGKARVNGITRPHARAGHAKIRPQTPRSPRQQGRTAHIRHQPDRAFRHRDLRAFADNPVTGMARHPHPAPHAEPLYQHHHRLCIAVNPVIHPVFVAPEIPAKGKVASGALRIQLGNIAAGAERLGTRRVDHHQIHRRIGGPADQRRIQHLAHAVRQRVQRLGPVQRGPARPTDPAQQDVGHRRAPVRVRAMITRMISLVPSRI